jgi:hypothetical protein
MMARRETRMRLEASKRKEFLGLDFVVWLERSSFQTGKGCRKVEIVER